MLKKLTKTFSNLPGWRTNRKIIVIESDDWGSVRMPSKIVKETLEARNVSMGDQERQRYTNYDTLANEKDFDALYNILIQFKDIHAKHPVFTAVSVVANPDFHKIKEADFKEYFYEPFTITLENYGNISAFKMWQEGMSKNLFVPQFHGREHLNVQFWMRQLLGKDDSTIEAFNQNCWGFENKNEFNIDYQAAFDLEFASDIQYQKSVIKEGLQLFEQIHGYKADFFVPPNGPFNNELEKVAALGGIKYMSASKIQSEPQGQGVQKKRIHWLGQKNLNGQYYITRNCFFEPSASGKDWVASCMVDIENAFKWSKPAVISSHRVNYIGGLNEKNRTNGLQQLERLLNRIQGKWPNVEFMTSSQLGDLISRNN
jgi:hypothetical protein